LFASALPPLLAQRPDIVWMRGGSDGNLPGSGITPIVTPVFSSDGQYVMAWQGGASSIKIYQVSTGLLLQTVIPFPNQAITAASLSPDSTLFAAASSNQINIYSFPAAELLSTLPYQPPSWDNSAPPSLSFSTDDSLITTQDGYITISGGAFTEATIQGTPGSPSDAKLLNPVFVAGGIAGGISGGLDLAYGPVLFPWTTYPSPSLYTEYGEGTGATVSSGDGYITQGGPVYPLAGGPAAFTLPGGFVCGIPCTPFSSNGQILAQVVQASPNPSLNTYQTGSWNLLASTTFNQSPGQDTYIQPHIGFSADSQSIVAGNPLIQILSAGNLSVQSTIAYDWNMISSVAYSPDGSFVVSGGLDGQAISWNAADGSLRNLLLQDPPGSQVQVESVAVSPNGQLIAVTNCCTGPYGGGYLQIYSVSSGALLNSIATPGGPEYGTAFLGDSQTIALSGGGFIELISAATGTVSSSYTVCSSGGFETFTLFADDQRAVVNCEHTAEIINVFTGSVLATLTPPTNGSTSFGGGAYVCQFAVSPDGTLVGAGLVDPPGGSVVIFDSSTGEILQTLTGAGTYASYPVAFSSDGSTIAAGNSNATLTIWNLSNGSLLQTFTEETGDLPVLTSAGPDAYDNIPAITYSPNNQYIYYGRADGSSVLIDNPNYVPVSPASGVSISPSSTTGGGNVTGTVTLYSPAPASGQMVYLYTGNPAVATVPASVAVPSGATSAPFTIATTAVASTTSVSITAAAGGIAQSATLSVLPVGLSAITLSPSSVAGGTSTTGNTVTLGGPAPAGGLVVTLSSSNPSVASPQPSITVPPGATTSPDFTIATTPVAASAPVTITASSNGSTIGATLTVLPPALVSVAVSPAKVTGGASSSGTVTLATPAPSGGLVVSLSSSNTAVAVTPASVTVAAGATASSSFTIKTSAVRASTPVTITASSNGASVGATLTVLPPGLAKVTVSPASVTGGTSSSGTVTLSSAAPAGGLVVQLSSSKTAAATTPSTVTVAAGSTVSPAFTITTFPVAASTAVTITASSNGAKVSATLTVLPPALASVSVSPASVIGGTSSSGTVTLGSAAPTGGLVVDLKSSDAAAAATPASVTVPAGAIVSPAFPITTTPVTAQTTVTISAVFNGVSKTAKLVVNSPKLGALTLSPKTVTGGKSTASNTVTLSGPAPTGGIVVALSSSSTVASLPASVTVAAGATVSPDFTITTSKVTASTNVTITASYGGVSKTATLTVEP
jgi:WD40 repeat protein